jgi:hypothetical protein
VVLRIVAGRFWAVFGIKVDGIDGVYKPGFYDKPIAVV